MMRLDRLFLTLWASVILVACGSTVWQIRDDQGQVVEFQDPNFTPQEVVRLRIGGAYRDIEAREVVSLTILDSVKREIIDGRVWLPCSVSLEDGTSFSKEVYLPAEGNLEGRKGRHKVGIGLDRLREFGRSVAEPQDSTKTNPIDSARADSTAKADSALVKPTVPKDSTSKDSTISPK